MQTTLNCPAISSAEVKVESQNSTILSDEHINYLYAHSFEGMIEEEISNHLSKEKDELDELRRRYDEFKQYDTHQKKSQTYIRIGRRC